MSQRKIQQEIERCFKQVAIGVEAFDAQYDKYEQSNNASQRDKLVDSIKKECKKLQRLRDQIKTWAAGNEVKDKTALQDKRELIETKMEAFKAVEKEMKTKAFSKEGLLTSAKQDPKEQEKEEMDSFLAEMVQELQQQIEALEAETEQLQVQAKKSKKDSAKTERVSELETKIERHKWHVGKLEHLQRALVNENVDPEQVRDAQEDIKYYVENNQEVDFAEDEELYENFNLEEEGGRYGFANEVDRVSSHENITAQDEVAEPAANNENGKQKSKSISETNVTSARQPSLHNIKSPLPALATLNTVQSAPSSTSTSTMKPAPLPSKPPGEGLKYASAAAAAAASDAAGIGIAPLPPPPSKAQNALPVAPSLTPAHNSPSIKSSAAGSPAITMAQPSNLSQKSESVSKPLSYPGILEKAALHERSPAPSHSSMGIPSPAYTNAQLSRDSIPDTAANGVNPSDVETRKDGQYGQNHDRQPDSASRSGLPNLQTPSQTNGLEEDDDPNEEQSIYHLLPACLQELIDSFEAVKSSAAPMTQPEQQRLFNASWSNRPDIFDAERPRHYKPQNPAAFTPAHYPQEPLPIFDDPRLYSKLDTDALFYSFYYRQGTYQQYLAAKALKDASWRFHKQYQTWFQRHDEPKSITEDYEQGTYRFFDYESTWMNRRKADFQFSYKYLEDDF